MSEHTISAEDVRPRILFRAEPDGAPTKVRVDDGPWYDIPKEVGLENLRLTFLVAFLKARALCAEAPEATCWPSCGCGYAGETLVNACERHVEATALGKCLVCDDFHISDKQRCDLEGQMENYV